MLKRLLSLSFIFLLSLCLADLCGAVEDPGSALERVGVDSAKRGQKVDLSLKFTDTSGRELTLSEFMIPGKPLVITPVYYHCPRLCGFFLNGFVTLLNDLALRPGRDFNILTFSIDPAENSEMAGQREAQYKRLLVEADSGAGWHFTIGSKDNVEALASQIGFKFFPDGPEFAHTSAFIILTPEGEISQYFTGIDFSAWDVKLAMVDASKGAIGSAIDHILLFCFRFDPTSGKYTWAAFNVMRSGVILSALLMGALVFVSLRKA